MATLANADRRSRFFVWMAAFALLIAVAGFAPTYWLPMVGGRSFPPILHIHGTIFLAWNSLYLWQCWLVATNRTADHRQWGLVGISVATAQEELLAEKEPSLQFTTPQELGELAVFFCSPAGNNVRGVAWQMDGAWTAQ